MRHFTFEIYNVNALDIAIQSMQNDQCTHDSFLVCHLFCGGYSNVVCSELINDIKAKITDRCVIVGVASNAEFLNGRVTDPIPVLSVLAFDSSEATLLYETDIHDSAKETGQKFAEQISTYTDVKAVELLICNSGERILDFFQEIEACDKSIQIFGGMPFGHDILNDPRYIIVDGNITERGVAAIIYRGEELHVNANYTSGWKPLGRTFKVTKAENCTIYEINKEPAINVYKKYLGVTEADNFMNSTSEFPLLVKKAGGDMLRHPEVTNEDGSISLDGYVETGMVARISYGDPETIVNDIDARCSEIAEFSPEAVLIYSCAARKLFWGPFINNEVTPFDKLAPMSGFCTGGEISRDMTTGEVMWHNITVVSVAFREGEKTKHVEPSKVDMSDVHGQTSLVKRLMTLVKETTRELEEMAIRDELTGLYNRRATDQKIDEILGQSPIMSFIMIDIDHFKNVNDAYGHDTGDVILKGVAHELERTAEEAGGFVGRWGGEEFFAIFPDTDEGKASRVAESLRTNVAALDFDEVGHVTISLGTLSIDESVDWASERKTVFCTVDDALYEAKNNGRNRIVCGRLERGA